MTTLRPFLSFYGAKWRAANRYPKPESPLIVEPFAGSAGYALHYADLDVVLLDLDPVIAGVWDYLIHVSSAEILALPLLGPGTNVDDLGPVPQEAKWLVGFWLNGGASGPRKRPSKWMLSRPDRSGYWGSAIRDRIASQVGSIRHWTIENAHYTAAHVTKATWFVDPPYQGAGKHYRMGSKGIDYAALGQWCQELPGQVIVCENDGATWLPFSCPFDIRSNPAGRGVRTSREVTWTSVAR